MGVCPEGCVKGVGVCPGGVCLRWVCVQGRVQGCVCVQGGVRGCTSPPYGQNS